MARQWWTRLCALRRCLEQAQAAIEVEDRRWQLHVSAAGAAACELALEIRQEQMPGVELALRRITMAARRAATSRPARAAQTLAAAARTIQPLGAARPSFSASLPPCDLKIA